MSVEKPLVGASKPSVMPVSPLKESRERLRQMLDGTPSPLKLHPVKPGASSVCGKSFVGLISRFPVLLDMGCLPSFDGRVVFIESTPKYADVSEPILDDLVAKGKFEKAAAVVFCDFNRKWEKSTRPAF